MLSARATRGLEATLLLGLLAPLLEEWFQTTSASSRLSYALLVPALALALAWRARGGRPTEGRVLETAADARGSERSGALLALAAATLLLAGGLSGLFTLSLCAVPLVVAAYVARWGGRAELARQAPALALLFAMVPPPMPILDRINPLLVQASGATAVRLLTPFDPAVTWAGATLGFRGWTLIVAEACSGSGTFLTLGVLCAFLAGLFRLRALPGLALLALSFPLTLLVNGTRIASSALLIDRFGAEAGHGLAHELLGQVVVIASAAALALVVERWTARSAPLRN